MTARRLFIAMISLIFVASPAFAGSPIAWKNWSAGVLEDARRENRFILLDLEAVWCHWCHVMEATTYQDPTVVALLQSKYLAVRADQDANPDLSARYGDWGWPATIILAPDGTELVKRRGYIPPGAMASLLQAVIDDPTPGPSVTQGIDEPAAPGLASSKLPDELKTSLAQQFSEAYDATYGGWGGLHKYIDADSMDWVLNESEQGNQLAREMAQKTLDAATALIDPVWGGIYQYSDAKDWSSPHYEKIMWYQANGLRQYALAYAQFQNPKYLAAADALYRYLTTRLLSPEGAFYTSQDADADHETPGKTFYALDHQQRRALGRQPRIDTNVYARENGWAISALVAYAGITGNPDALSTGERAADWIFAHRLGPDGRMRHGAEDRAGPFLGDTIAMGNASLDLYAATGKRVWLERARALGTALAAFKSKDGGFAASLTPEGNAGVFAKAYVTADEQPSAARFATRLWRYLGRPEDKELAEHAVKYLAAEAARGRRPVAPALLLLDRQLSHEPLHITVVGNKDDAAAVALHEAAVKFPATDKRIDWWDRREGPMMNGDITYPELAQAAVFACSNRLCSLPAYSAEELKTVVTQMIERSGPIR